jgi:hypothetical protein
VEKAGNVQFPDLQSTATKDDAFCDGASSANGAVLETWYVLKDLLGKRIPDEK